MCGKIVNQDASLGHVHTTPGVTDASLNYTRRHAHIDDLP
jgi:hypothetical protein